MKHPNLLIGEIVTDHYGTLWKRTYVRDETSTYEDNYYYMPIECFCDVDIGVGYTFSDEHGYGNCSYCTRVIVQINGYNDEISVNYDNPDLFKEEQLHSFTINTKTLRHNSCNIP